MTVQELELPKGWTKSELGDFSISEIIMGQSPPGSTYNKGKNGLPFFQGKKDFGEKFPMPTIWCSMPKSGGGLIWGHGTRSPTCSSPKPPIPGHRAG